MAMWVPLAIWIGVCGIVFSVLAVARPRYPSREYMLLAVGVIAAVVRLVPVALYPDPRGLTATDINNFYFAATAVLDGRDVYTLRPIGIYPYPPLHLYVFAVAKAIADNADVSFFSMMRVPQALADAGTAVILAGLVRRVRGEAEGWRAGLLYAACPLPVLATVYHGQFDSVSVFFAVVAYWALLRAEARPEWLALSAAALAMGTLEKVWPALLLPVLLVALPDNVARGRYLAIVASIGVAVTLMYMLAFGSTPGRIYDNFADYLPIQARFSGLGLVVDRTFGDDGSDFLRWFVHNGREMSLIAALGANAVAIALRLSLSRSIILVLCAVFLTSPEAHPYHLLWIIPFALAADDRGFLWVLVATAGTAYAITLLFAGGMFLPPHDGAAARRLVEHRWWLEYSVWFVVAAWAIWSLGTGLRRIAAGIRAGAA